MLKHYFLRSHSVAYPVLLALALSLDACTPKDGEATDGDSATSSATDTGPTTGEPTGEPVLGCPDHENVDACCCFLRSEAPNNDVENVCAAGQPPLCPAVTFTCAVPDSPDAPCETVFDEAAVDCALNALAGTKPGVLSIGYSGNVWGSGFDYALQGDGTTYLVHLEGEDLGNAFEPTGRFTLKPPAFFTDCLTKSLGERSICLREAVMGEISEVCLEGFTFEGI